VKWRVGDRFGTRRSIRHFCLLPRTFGYPAGVTVWLEWVRLEQEYVRGRVGDFWVVRNAWDRDGQQITAEAP
jgi:hypothetical protein